MSVLIAVIAIAVAFALWKNSKEQKDIAENFFREQDKIIRARNQAVEIAESKLESLIVKYEKQLNSATKENKKEIQEAIQELNKEKASIGAFIGPSGSSVLGVYPIKGGTYSSILGLGNIRKMVCNNCGKTFNYNDDSLSRGLQYTTSISQQSVHCTHCGTVNYPS